MNSGLGRLTWWFMALLVLGLLAPVFAGQHRSADVNYLLTVVAATGTLAGLAFAIYGWYTAHELPNTIEQKLREHAARIERELSERLYRQQEASQKVLASYGVKDPDQRIALLKGALDADPAVYNGWIALGYVYWYDKQDLLAAAECFQMDLKYHPKNHQAACDLVALYAQQSEWLSALSWMKKAVELNPSVWDYFESDVRLDGLRQQRRDDYDRIIADAKRRGSSPDLLPQSRHNQPSS